MPETVRFHTLIVIWRKTSPYADTTRPPLHSHHLYAMRTSRNILMFCVASSLLNPLTDSELASRHRARKSSIQIVKTDVIPAKKCTRPAVTPFHNSKLKFKLNHRVARPSSKAFAQTFKAKRPCSFF